MNLINDVNEEVLRWRNALLAEKDDSFLFFDGFFVSNKRPNGEATSEGFLSAMGVIAEGCKKLLAFEFAPSESRASERLLELLFGVKKLFRRAIKLVVSYGSQGRIQALNACLPDVHRQRCVLHKTKNIIGNSSFPPCDAHISREGYCPNRRGPLSPRVFQNRLLNA